MNAYFFKMTNEERSNILDQHKEVYDGYVTKQNQVSNEQPLYVQDYANDKGGITVSNKGEVMPYKNMNINEDVYSGSAGSGMMEPEETFEDDTTYVSVGEQLDMIGDGEHDLDHGTFNDDEDETIVLMSPESDEFELDDIHGDEDNEEDFEFNLFGDNDFDDEEKGEISNQIFESLKMFNRMNIL